MGILDRATRKRLLDALENLGVFNTSSGRSLLLADLPSALVSALERSSAKVVDLTNIVDACNNWDPDAFGEGHPLWILIENARDLVKDSLIARQLQVMLNSLSDQSGEHELNGEAETPSPTRPSITNVQATGGIAIGVIHGGTIIQQNNSTRATPARPPSDTTPVGSRGIPAHLYNPLRQMLLDCGPFGSNGELQAVFAHQLLALWKTSLPEADSRTERVDATINFLVSQRRSDMPTSALVLFLGVLRDRTDPSDECYGRLAELTDQLAAAEG